MVNSLTPDVIFEDDSIIVINKPAGMSVHSDGVHDYPTVVEWLHKHYPDIEGVGEPQTLNNGTTIDRPGIVHRLDRETSGVMVIAKTQDAFLYLKHQFGERLTRKTYRTFVYGIMKEERGIVDKPIGSSRGNSPRSARFARGTMRDAVTAYSVLYRGKDATYVDVFPKTGRTHQIRVHFSGLQRPIVADTLYAPKRKPILGFNRLALHAYTLVFKHPKTHKEVEFTAPLPPDFTKAEAQLRAQ